MNAYGDGLAKQEFDAGPDQTLVVYSPEDIGTELDPLAIFQEIAADAATRARDGMWIASMTSIALRHAGAMFGNDGSGYETSVAVAVVYERRPRVTG